MTSPRHVIDVGSGFWNIRGSYKIRGIVDIGTHASLVRRASGKFVLLDACAFSDATHAWLHETTGAGKDLEAIVHLHPFHTMHVRSAHERYPHAKLFGTARHHEMFEDLPWEPLRTEDPEFHVTFSDDFAFSIPRGVDFVSKNPNLHFSSVLALHRASKTLHIDDTLVYLRLPLLFPLFGMDVTRLHPSLAKVLEPRAGAVKEFREWSRELLDLAKDVENLCAAHAAVLLGRKNNGAPVASRIADAIAKVDGVLQAHERIHGA